ncbi:MAG: hypothetical protein NZM00_11415 [Anaerolinea sp.]|nr:hypothetical protein [Anaerolinea sp.]
MNKNLPGTQRQALSSKPPPPSRPASTGFPARLGVRTVEYLLPAHDTVARIDLRLIGTALYDLLDVQVVDFDPHDIDRLIKILETDRQSAEQLHQQADTYWERHIWKGVVQVYAWNDAVLNTVQTRLTLIQDPQMIVHVTDPLLAINLLGRTRGSLLLPRAPLALERAYLERSIACDDPRIISLALYVGCPYVALADPTSEDTETATEDDSA